MCITELHHLYTLLIESKPALSKAENAPKCSHLSNVSERKRHRTKLFTCRSIKTFFCAPELSPLANIQPYMAATDEVSLHSVVPRLQCWGARFHGNPL